MRNRRGGIVGVRWLVVIIVAVGAVIHAAQSPLAQLEDEWQKFRLAQNPVLMH